MKKEGYENMLFGVCCALLAVAGLQFASCTNGSAWLKYAFAFFSGVCIILAVLLIAIGIIDIKARTGRRTIM